ncbi:hypothetical protein HETIRDRAFT_311856 [Heterobasidion irregulare TC 32-1]|uniref:Uncharacterized protein n=1 Tax=Heterobasidion irregulare (strain TC 32-1) TaxID=747525 RepID=W4KEV8_HETIT|nr:uncharacterized protein HETIRDRAFT_311856 [Heterobasidion irregulare TC 32-1]ETW84377.1 hypothetical protein HETIRDRAFT_311856 [Heterobasidion irregulare TC 32-1]
MSTVSDVSSKLGEYMLKGWVLTDKSCPTPGCRVPLMRSPNGQNPVTWFCANCEGTHQSTQSTASTTDSVRHGQSSPSILSSTHYSRPSTPPTEVSSTLSSPTFALPAETAEIIHRRQQSDLASAEIGKRLLKGWAMLADECPTTTCYGIPLVRPPKVGGEKDPRKECVVCGNIYVDEKDSQGFDRLIPIELGTRQQSLRPGFGTDPLRSSSQDKGKSVARDETPVPQHMSSLTQTVLDASVQSLESSLMALSQRLSSLADQTIIDPSSIAQTADAMSKIAQALSSLKQLQ